jgi:hypothetical protein
MQYIRSVGAQEHGFEVVHVAAATPAGRAAAIADVIAIRR